MSRYRDRDWPDYGPSRSLDHFDNYNHKHPRHPSSVANGWYDDIMDRSSDRGRGFSGRYPPPESYSAPYGGRGSPQLKPRWPQQPGYNDAIKQRSKPPAKDKPPRKKKTNMDVARKFAENTSLGGMAYMNISNRWWSTAFWVFVFVVGMGFCTAHLYLIFQNFYSYPYSTIDELQFDFLPFPSVTVCNRNPIRVSGRPFVSPEMRSYLDGLAPTASAPMGKRKKRQVQTQAPMNRPQGSFVISSAQSTRFSNYETFLELYGNITTQGRLDAGHQKDVMIVDCSFNGYQCYTDNFTAILSPEYGNCFTFNSARNSDTPYLSRQNGRTYGLRLELFAEIQEYPTGVTDTKGFSVSIHPFHTMPFPEVTGVSVSPGYETSIGIKYTNVTKLGDPYNNCNDPNSYLAPFDAYYTQQTCQTTCHYRKIIEVCGCYYSPFELYYASEVFRTERNCYESTDITCVSGVESAFKDGTYSCTCYPGCTETKYQFQYSTVAWPERSLVNTYSQKACQLSPKVCTAVTNSSETPLTVISENFGVLNVYFDELAFHNIYEKETYNEFSLASDVGGTLGLWLGVSILTGVEVIQFVVELIRNSCR